MKVSVIIPAYNAHKTLPRCLASIMIQSIVKDLEVIVVDDCSPDGGYEKEISTFRPFMNIREITLEKNGGPGVARQAGIDDCKTPFFTCIDADDTFAGAYALECLAKYLDNPGVNMVSSVFIEVHEEDENKKIEQYFVPHQNDIVWMFGKMYRKAFIDANKIRFNETRANEDNGFNCKVRLCGLEDSIVYIDDITYYWHDNPNSITRINDCQYSYDQSFVGYVDNMIDAIEHCKKINPFNPQIIQHAYEVMFNLYAYYLEVKQRDSRFLEQALEYCKKYYKSIYSKLSELDESVISSIYAKSLMGKYQPPIPQWVDILPDILFKDFIELLKK